ncbi:hypothetical protein [Oceanibaculum nanhaiense]|uniref:hypothetical protein n=1 Tax=Oceanibaculum nanhaiense TaxID=1909734 RepID=UPI003D2C0F66
MTEYYIPGATPAFVRAGQPFTLSGVQYPRKWLALASAGDLTEIGAAAKPAPGTDEVVRARRKLAGWCAR